MIALPVWDLLEAQALGTGHLTPETPWEPCPWMSPSWRLGGMSAQPWGLAPHEGASAGTSGLRESQLPSFHVHRSLGAAGPFTGLPEAMCPLSVQTELSRNCSQLFQASVLC